MSHPEQNSAIPPSETQQSFSKEEIPLADEADEQQEHIVFSKLFTDSAIKRLLQCSDAQQGIDECLERNRIIIMDIISCDRPNFVATLLDLKQQYRSDDTKKG